jgi:hypothetical protein
LEWYWDTEKIQKNENLLVRISKEYGILCSKTHFVVLDKREEEQKVHGNMVTFCIPAMLPHDWHGILPSQADDCLDPDMPPDDWMKQKIGEEVEWTVRTMNCLSKANIVTLGDLVRKTERDLMMLQNFGTKSLKEVKSGLQEIGLSLGMSLPVDGHSNQPCLPSIGRIDWKNHDCLYLLLSYQRAEGGFDADPRLFDILKIPAEEASSLAEQIKTKGATDKKILLATSLVLSFLSLRLDARKDFWNGLMSKSVEWFRRQMALYEPVMARKPLDQWAKAYLTKKRSRIF